MGRVHGRLAAHDGGGVVQSVPRLIELTANDFDELSFGNQGRVLARGLEFEAEVRSAGVQFVGSYALQRARDRDTEQEVVELASAPRQASTGL